MAAASTIASCRCCASSAPRVAGAFDVQVVDRVPATTHDLTVDLIVSETRILAPAARDMTVSAARSVRTALIALAATLAIQIFTSLAATTPAVLAPALADEMGIAPGWIGVFVGLVYAGAMLASIASIGFIERFGAIRVSQVCVILCAGGIALVGLLPATAVGMLVAAAILIGLGYGPITPASSQVLARTTPPSQMALMFSLKQTGVPAGAALAGALLPAAALTIGWRAAALDVGFLGVLIACAAQPTRRALDTDLRPGRAFSAALVIDRMRLVARSPALVELAALSFAYASVQVCLTSFLVVYLHDTLHWSLVAAGLALTVATVGGVIGRIAWGAMADRTLAPRRVLSLIGVLAASAASRWPARPRRGRRRSCCRWRRCSAARRSAGTASSCPNWRGTRRRGVPAP